MLTHDFAQTIYTKMVAAPAGWLRSAAGRRLQAKALRMVVQRCGVAEARTLAQLLTVARTFDAVTA